MKHAGLFPVKVQVNRVDGTSYEGTVWKKASDLKAWAQRHLADPLKGVKVWRVPAKVPEVMSGTPVENRGDSKPIPPRKWVDKIPGLPELTIDKHYTNLVKNEKGEFVSGTPTPERKKLHDEIRAKFLDRAPVVPKTHQPVAILMMGGPASGKSALTKTLPKDLFVHVDPDEIKGKLPEYQDAIKGSAKNAALMAHEESGILAKEIRDLAIAQRKNLLFDGTGKNADGYMKQIAKLKAAGYHVQIVMPDVDVDEAAKRSALRAEKTGRWVPEDILRDAHRVIPQNFLQLARAADSARLFDARTNPPRQVWSQEGGKETADDAQFMAKFPPLLRGSGTPRERQT